MTSQIKPNGCKAMFGQKLSKMCTNPDMISNSMKKNNHSFSIFCWKSISGQFYCFLILNSFKGNKIQLRVFFIGQRHWAFFFLFLLQNKVQLLLFPKRNEFFIRFLLHSSKKYFNKCNYKINRYFFFMNWEIEKLKQERQKQKKRQSLHQVTIAYSNLKKSNQERKSDDYIDYLQQENRKLLGTLTKQRQQYQKKTIRFQQIIREKDLLLEQCQREIGLVKKQYQIISKGEGGQRKSKKEEFQVKPNHKLLEKISDI